MAEEESSMKGSILRQLLKTRRAFHGTVIDLQGNVVLKIDRPVKWFLNSQMSITDANDNIIGEVKQLLYSLNIFI